MKEIIAKTKANLEKNNISVFTVEKASQIPEIVKSLIKKGEVISCGGSVSLAESGVMDLLKCGDYKFIDRTQYDDVRQAYLESFDADTYFSSANALTEDGEIINVDGRCNRVAALLYGPKQVVYVIGANKIVPDIMSGFKRIKEIAAPKNTVRLNCDTPCAKTGKCISEDLAKGCLSPQRICSGYVISSYQRDTDRVKVILCNESLGY